MIGKRQLSNRTSPALLALFVVAGCGAGEDVDKGTEHVGSSSAALTEACGQSQNGPVQGYDISEFQPNFNWQAAKDNDGIAFGYARISYGTGHPDLTFDGNWKKLKDAGLLRGAYQYFLPTQDVAQQAQIVIDKIGKLGVGDLPVQFDVEPTAEERGGLSGSQIAAKMHQWLDLVEAGTGKRPFIYTNAYLWQDSIASNDFGKYGLWISNYGPPSGCPVINDGWTKWVIWQYSDGNGTLDHNVFNGTLAELKAYAGAPGGGGGDDASDPYPTLVRKSSADLNGDGQADVCARAIRGLTCALSKGDGFQPEFDGPKWSDGAGWNKAQYRETIQFGDIDGDGKADACGRGPDGITCAKSNGTGFADEVAGPAWSDEAGFDDASRYATVQLADVNGDGKLDVCARKGSGITCSASTGAGFSPEFDGPAWSDDKGWNRPDQYATIQFADVDGDGRADACGRDANGIVCALSNGAGFPTEVRGPAWSNASGWNKVQYGSTIRFVDVDGDGRADVCGRGPDGIACALSTGAAFGGAFAGPAWTDDKGFGDASSYRTLQWADINGDKKADVCARTAKGVVCAPSQGTSFGAEIDGPPFSDGDGWNQEKYFSTIAAGDVNHDGKDDICGRAPTGFLCAVSNGAGFGAPSKAADWSDGQGFGAVQYYATTRVIGSAPTAKYTGAPVGSDGGATVDGGTQPGSDGGVSTPDSITAGPGPVTDDGCSISRTSGRGPGLSLVALTGVMLGLVVRRRRVTRNRV